MLSKIIQGGGDAARNRRMAETAETFLDVPALAYVARYERARAMAKAGDQAGAQGLFGRLFDEAVDAGRLPPIDDGFYNTMATNGNEDAWADRLRQTAARLIDHNRRTALIALAWRIGELGDHKHPPELVSLALADVPKRQRLATVLAAVWYFHDHGQHARAEAALKPLFDDKRYARDPSLWRLAAVLADDGGRAARAVGCLERAAEIEYEEAGEEFDLHAVRRDYGRLLQSYAKLATAMATLEPESKALIARVVRAADRWRSLDVDPTAACQAAASILNDLGAAELAWDYATTPLAAKPDQAAPLVTLAEELRQQAQLDLAARAYASAFDAEPDNAQILWDRAQVLLQSGRASEAKELLRQLAEGSWPQAHQAIQSRAKQYIGY